MIESKGWKWNIVKDKNDEKCIWRNPSIESYFLLNRWLSSNKKDFLDLGCGLGRHSILFGKYSFNVYSFDISEDAINETRKWAEELDMIFDYKIGDMINLPYQDNSMDCILCRNVISHTDTEGIKKIISEIKRVLKSDGECYLTLCSKETWGYKQDWPKVDDNTKLCMIEGPEYKVPHFYADYNLIKDLFKEYEIIELYQIVEYLKEGYESYHYHLLIKNRIGA